VFAALDDDDSSTFYYTLAFIYALPYLGNGFELDGFALVSLLVCILHVQVGRKMGVGERASGWLADRKAFLLPQLLLHPAHALTTHSPRIDHALTTCSSFSCCQVERVAQTEPVEVELPSVLRRLLGGIPLAVRSLGRYR